MNSLVRKKKRGKYTQKQFIRAMKGTGGIKSAIAKKLGCEWLTVQKYIKEYPKIYDAWLAEKEIILDMGESVLFSLVKNEDLSAVKYLLSTQGKERGYGNSQEIELTGNKDKPIVMGKANIDELSSSERRSKVIQILKDNGGLKDIEQSDGAKAV